MLTARTELLRKHLDRFATAVNRAAKGDVRALHRTRVASRRLRELIPLLQGDPDVARKLGRRLRKVTRRLGSIRELDVLLLLIDELRARREFSPALARVAITVSKERDDARGDLSAAMPFDEARRTARRLARVLERLREAEQSISTHVSAEAWRWAIDARMAARAARLTATMTDAGAVYLPDRLHAVRIALKKLRYSVELATEAAGQRPSADLRTLKRSQDALGRLHDLQVLIDRVRQIQASLVPPSVSVWHGLDRLVTALENDCRRLHARYMRQRPRLGAIAARLSVHPESSHPRIAPSSARGSRRIRGAVELDRRSARRPVAV
jgi:CHAD domain-containing protein